MKRVFFFLIFALSGAVYASDTFCRYLGTNDGLSNSRVFAIAKDSKGYMWFLTPEGLDKYNGKQFIHYKLTTDGKTIWPTAETNSLHTDSLGNIWVHHKNGSHFRYDRNQDLFAPATDFPKSSEAGPTLHDEEGRIWEAVFPIGVSIHSDRYPAHELIQNPEAAGRAGNYITQLTEGADGIIGITTPQGYSTYDPRTGIWKNRQQPPQGLLLSSKQYQLPEVFQTNYEIEHITTVYQANEKTTYIGTHGNGLWILNHQTEKAENYQTHNSALISNNICCILPGTHPNELIISTDNELVCFHTKEKIFLNWTKEQGLLAHKFIPTAGVKTKDGIIAFGSNEGLLVIRDSIRLPRDFQSKLVLSDFNIQYQRMMPNQEGSPLTRPIDETESITLSHDQNIFSLTVSSINYDCPSRILYAWMLEGFYDEWTQPSDNNYIRYTGLAPGEYNLQIRAILLDDGQIMEERQLRILIEPPFTQTIWAFLIYTILLVIIIAAVVRYLWLRKDSHISREKIQFFIRTAHDIRTPLTLIKGPLSEINRSEHLSPKGQTHLQAAIQNTEKLSELATKLIDFQKEELYSSNIRVSSCEMNQYLNDFLKPFRTYADEKDIRLTLEQSEEAILAWIDKNKIDSIVHNLVSNALKYTPEGGSIEIRLNQNAKEWSLTISDTGIGIPEKDRKKMFKHLFRGENAVNQRITGTGIGMLQTHQLVKRHQGEITVSSKENQGTTFHLRFPIDNPKYVRQSQAPTDIVSTVSHPVPTYDKEATPTAPSPQAPTLLIVEDNPELRHFLHQAMQENYFIVEAENGQEALERIAEKQPDLILSDIMMPVMRGDDLCHTLKTRMETSHIPIILLTALGDRESILHGLQIKADNYIVKPFDIDILRASIASTLANKEFIRQRFAKLDYRTEDLPQTPGLSLDQEFLMKATEIVREHMDQDFNIDILCTEIGMSRSSLYNKIKALTDHSPSDFVRQIRMNEAADLLKSKKYTVAEISDRLGYNDPKYFTDIFKKHYGITPSAYMKQH